MSESKFEIKANSKALGNSGDKDVTIRYSSGDLCDFSGSGPTYTVKYPAIDCDNQDKAELKKPVDVELYIEGDLIEKGSGFLVQTQMGDDKFCRTPSFHEMSMAFDNSNLFRDLDGMCFVDLDWSAFEHEFNQSNIEAGWNYDFDNGDAYGYHLVQNKCWKKVPDGGLDADGNPTEKYIVTYDSFSPFISVKWVLEQALCIANKPGYELCSRFMDKDMFKNLIIPLCLTPYGNEYGAELHELQASGTAQTYGFAPYLDIPIEFSSVTSDPGNHWSPVDTYVTTEPGCYEVCVQMTLEFTGTGPITIIPTITIGGQNDFQSDPITFGGGFLGPVTLSFCHIVDVDLIGSQLGVQLTLGSGIVTGNEALTVSGQQIQIIYEHKFSLGSRIDFARLIPSDWKISDFIKGLGHLFGLWICTDTCERKVYIEPMCDTVDENGDICKGFFSGTDNLDTMVDLSAPSTRIPINDKAECFTLAYKENTADETYEAWEEGNSIPTQETKYTFPKGMMRNKEERKENPFFCKTLHVNAVQVNAGLPPKQPQLPLIWGGNYLEDPDNCEEPDCGCPRLLFFAGVRGQQIDGMLYMENFPGDTSCASRPFPQSFAVNYNNDGNDPNLSFADEAPYGNNPVMPGLTTLYHLKKLASWRKGCTTQDVFNIKFALMRKKMLKKKYFFCGKNHIPLEVLIDANNCNVAKIKLMEIHHFDQEDCDAVESTVLRSIISYLPQSIPTDE